MDDPSTYYTPLRMSRPWSPAAQPAGGGEFPFGTPVLDTFTDTNGVDLSAHDPDGAPGVGTWANLTNSVPMEVQSNQATGTAAGSTNFNRWDAANYGSDVAIYITVNTLPTVDADVVSLEVRHTGDVADFYDMSGYALFYNFNSGGDDTFQFYRMVAGGSNVAIGAAITQNLSAGDSFGFTLTGGNTLQAYYKPAAGAWAELSTARVDGSPLSTSAGKFALGTYSATVRLNDFGGGTI